MGLGCKSGPKVVPNASSENYCKVSNRHVIEHVLVGQNRGSTGSSADLVQASVVSRMEHSLIGLENLGRILSRFNGSSTTSLGDIILPVQASPVTLNVQFSVVQELSPFNVILGRTWLHYMKVIPSTYHQIVSFLTDEGQIDLYGSQLAARQCYQIAREAGTNREDAPIPEPSHTCDQ
ncbi:hypothetical protein CK203_085072 [Vitis vinifera]|uniref:Uncharacterized protein n=1 Tax=Vitis vinifera TaxID=29760 RepID=A0A438DV55_VITVI|nr:hypothetical protein CK203_085072 [Vitis vinifera]